MTAIRFYQRWISPYKGFRCAHRQLHGGRSCSEFTLDQIQERGVRAALPAIKKRFHECGEAARQLRLSRRTERLTWELRLRPEKTVAMARGRSAKRSLEERMYDDTEEKRKRLNELPGDNPWWVGPEWCDFCGVGEHCAVFGCLTSIIGGSADAND